MKKRFTEAQITFALRQADGGTPVGDATFLTGHCFQPVLSVIKVAVAVAACCGSTFRNIWINFSHSRLSS